jgi:putative ABC transport system ATP-binding protein
METSMNQDTNAHGATYALRGVSQTFGTGSSSVNALDGVNLEIKSGEFAVVAGKSGSGKTTLLQLMGALDRPSAGEVSFEGNDLAQMSDNELADLRRSRIGFVFQQFNLIPTLSAKLNVEAALAPSGLSKEESSSKAMALLEQVGLGNRADHIPTKLSGGEQQRVAIARALANDPDVMLADEPTGNLDSATGEEIMDLLTRLNQERGLTVVLITHDPEIAGGAARLIRLRDGRVEAVSQ